MSSASHRYRKKDNFPVAIKVIDLEESKDDIATINKEINTLTNGKSCQQLINYFGKGERGQRATDVCDR